MIRVRFLPLVIIGIASHISAADPAKTDHPAPTSEAAARMTVPEGFHVTLFAGEPDVVQPIAMTFDDRGRLWVVECLSYPNWKADGKGHDRVTIYEDTDGDGKHDKKTVFLDNGSNLSGIEIGFGGVWLCSVPNLLFVPDRNGDDKPDGPPEVVLDGWNFKDTKHNVFNSLGWGPDGWLYGCNGIQARSLVGKPGTPDKERTYLDCAVWRYHPTRKVFDVVAHGTTNPWGLDWDDYGQMFITNCVIDHLWHFVPGGHYQRMYGQDANPFTFGLMGPASDHKHWAGGHWTSTRNSDGTAKPEHSDAGGGHAHSGCCVYLGDNFPAEYRNSVFMCNIHGNRLNRDSLHRTPSGYAGKHEKDFLFAHDPWFRGLCVKQGPDGSLYVSDWTDTGECHNYEIADKTNGRVYKMIFGKPKPWKTDLSRLSDSTLAEQTVTERNEWVSRHARRILQERAASSKLDSKVADQLRIRLEKANDASRALRAAWALHAINTLTADDIQFMMKFSDPAVRSYAAILALDNPEPSKLIRESIAHLGMDESVLVRRTLAGQCHRLLKDDWQTAINYLLKRPADPDTALMLWYALEPQVSVRWIPKLARLPQPRVLEFAVRKLVADSRTTEEALTVCGTAMLHNHSNETLAALLRGIRDGLNGTKLPAIPPKGWDALYPKLIASKSLEVRALADEVGLILHDPKAITSLKGRMIDRAASTDTRTLAIERLAARKVEGLAPTLRGLLTDAAVRGAAVRALAAYPDVETPAAVLKVYPTLTATEKADAIQTLASRKEFATSLLDAIERKEVPKAEVTVFTARQIQALNDKAISDRLAKVWGTIRPASATRKAQSEKYKALLTTEKLKSADPAKGRAIFTKHCATCHKLFGEGGDIGPELTGSQRANLDYVLENVLDPSAVVPGEYRMTAFTLLDGRTLTGIIRKETPQAVTIRTVNEEITVPVADIDTRKPTPLSVMPDGLLDALKDDEVRDLVAYLASARQVPLPAGGS